MDEDDLPAGEWLCKRCRILDKIGYDKLVTTIKHNQKENLNGFKSLNSNHDLCDNGDLCDTTMASTTPADSPTAETTNADDHDRFEPTSAACNLKENRPNLVDLNEESDSEHKPSDDSIKNPFDLLVRAAIVMNPKQFQLPLEYTPPFLFPGTSKKPYLNPFSGQLLVNANNRNANKKLPHELDNGLVPLPIKICFECGRSCRKAPLIQCDYCPLLFHADCLDPPLTGLPIARWMCPHHVEPVLEEKLLESVSLSERVKLWEKYTGKVNCELVKLEFLKKNQRKNPMFRLKEPIGMIEKVNVPESVKQMYQNPPYQLIQDLQPKRSYMIKTNPEVNVEIKYEKPTEEEQSLWLDSITSMQNEYAERLIRNKIKSESIAPAHDENDNEEAQLLQQITNVDDLSKLDDKYIRILAMQRLQQLLRPQQTSLTSKPIVLSPKSHSVKSITLTPIDLNIKSHSSIESANQSGLNQTNAFEFTSLDDRFKRHAYAVLCPVASASMSKCNSASVPMFGSLMSIGCDATCTLNLRLYSNCKHFSDQHACIFLDQASYLFFRVAFDSFLPFAFCYFGLA
jgi:hypothetical protein